MNPHDYILSVDENGFPYLEHALFGNRKGSSRQNHKYYTRVEDKGRWRYFYNPEEFRVWSQGGKKVSNTEKMKQGLQKLKDAGTTAAKNAVEKAKDVAGFDEREAAAKAWSKVPKAVSSGDKKAMAAFAEANKAQDAYRRTPLGKAEYLSERAKEIATGQDGSVKDVAKKLAEGTKSKIDRMKDEFRKKKEAEESPKEEPKADAKFDRLKAHEKPEASGVAKEDAMKRHTTEKSTYAEYKDGDKDFDDDNYKEENRVGDTDFFVHTREDGTNVILEEDMKWVLPKGIDAKSPEIQKAIKDFSSHVESARKLGENYTGQQWRDAITNAIDDAVRKTPLSDASADQPYVSKEYLEELEFNSRKNNYFGR